MPVTVRTHETIIVHIDIHWCPEINLMVSMAKALAPGVISAQFKQGLNFQEFDFQQSSGGRKESGGEGAGPH